MSYTNNTGNDIVIDADLSFLEQDMMVDYDTEYNFIFSVSPQIELPPAPENIAPQMAPQTITPEQLLMASSSEPLVNVGSNNNVVQTMAPSQMHLTSNMQPTQPQQYITTSQLLEPISFDMEQPIQQQQQQPLQQEQPQHQNFYIETPVWQQQVQVQHVQLMQQQQQQPAYQEIVQQTITPVAPITPAAPVFAAQEEDIFLSDKALEETLTYDTESTSAVEAQLSACRLNSHPMSHPTKFCDWEHHMQLSTPMPYSPHSGLHEVLLEKVNRDFGCIQVESPMVLQLLLEQFGNPYLALFNEEIQERHPEKEDENKYRYTWGGKEDMYTSQWYRTEIHGNDRDGGERYCPYCDSWLKTRNHAWANHMSSMHGVSAVTRNVYPLPVGVVVDRKTLTKGKSDKPQDACNIKLQGWCKTCTTFVPLFTKKVGTKWTTWFRHQDQHIRKKMQDRRGGKIRTPNNPRNSRKRGGKDVNTVHRQYQEARSNRARQQQQQQQQQTQQTQGQQTQQTQVQQNQGQQQQHRPNQGQQLPMQRRGQRGQQTGANVEATNLILDYQFTWKRRCQAQIEADEPVSPGTVDVITEEIDQHEEDEEEDEDEDEEELTDDYLNDLIDSEMSNDEITPNELFSNEASSSTTPARVSPDPVTPENINVDHAAFGEAFKSAFGPSDNN